MRDESEIGDFISVDSFVLSSSGWLAKRYGKKSGKNHNHGGTIYQYAVSGTIWVQNQVSLDHGTTVMGNQRFEEWIYEQSMVKNKHYHADNGIFQSSGFRKDCSGANEFRVFSAVGDQHQNGKAERTIQTIICMGQSFRIH